MISFCTRRISPLIFSRMFFPDARMHSMISSRNRKNFGEWETQIVTHLTGIIAHHLNCNSFQFAQ
jgi:hypothetical protein